MSYLSPEPRPIKKEVSLLDFVNAGLLIAAVFAVTKLVGKMIPAVTGAALQAVALAVGIATTFLVAYSDWAPEQVIGGKPMDQLSTASLVLVGLMIGGGATIADQGFKAVSNVGDNQP